MVCSKCFETNEDDAEFCSDCGAPLKEGGDGSDQEVYRDLSRANLLRMRGEFKPATDVCLGILRRFPNNYTANSLLGDICVDQGDLAQAETWYEMALDLNPDSKIDHQKLANIRERIAQKDSASTAEMIGLPQSTPKYGMYVALVSILLVGVAIAAYFVGKMGNKPESDKQTTTQVISQPNPIENKPIEPNPSDNKESSQESIRPQVPAESSSTDQALLNTLKSKASEKVRFVSVTEDPRGQSAIVSIEPFEGEAHGITATRAGLEFFQLFPAFKKITLRVLTKDGIAFVGDMSAESAITAKAATDGGDTIESQAQVSLSNVWTPPHREEGSGAKVESGN